MKELERFVDEDLIRWSGHVECTVDDKFIKKNIVV